MNRIRTIIYALNDGFYNLKRGGFTGIISIITIAFTLLNLGLFFLLWVNISPILGGWMKEVKVVGYLKDEVDEGCIERLKDEICGIEYVKKVEFVSKTKAIERFRASLGKEGYLLEGFNENPLPASFELLLDEYAGLDAIKNITAKLKLKEEFEEIQSGSEWMQSLNTFFVLVKGVGILVGGILIFISIFIISNTIRLTFINRRDEVEIMLLVGAQRWFIKMPFLIEGILDGLLGGCVSIGLLYLLYYVTRCRLTSYFLGTFGILHPSFLPASLILLLLGLGMGLGGIGSLFSLKV